MTSVGFFFRTVHVTMQAWWQIHLEDLKPNEHEFCLSGTHLLDHTMYLLCSAKFFRQPRLREDGPGQFGSTFGSTRTILHSFRSGMFFDSEISRRLIAKTLRICGNMFLRTEQMEDYRRPILLAIGAAAAAHLIVSLASGQPAKTSPVDSAKEETTRVTQINEIKLPARVGDHKRLDLAFCIDTTGSMQGEIDTVKANVKSVVAKLSSGQQKPVVRVGLVAYRDKGDEYVTKVFPFSEDIDKVTKEISDLQADGGGDAPEAVDQGVHVALNELKWDGDKHTAKLLYLIGDAPPHSDHHDFDLKAEAQNASASGICINAIGCDGLESNGDGGIAAFKQIASLTNGKFQTLAYHQEVVDASGERNTLITSGGKTYKIKSETVLAHGGVAPLLQGATNGTIGAMGSDATVITGVNTAGTVRVNNNLGDLMLQGAQDLFSK